MNKQERFEKFACKLEERERQKQDDCSSWSLISVICRHLKALVNRLCT